MIPAAVTERMIHIACCFDRHFQTAFTVLAHSIDRHTDTSVVIHAIHDGPVPYAAFVARRLRRTKVVFHDGTAVAGRYDTAGRQTRVTFVRLFLHELLAGMSKVLYLDTDIVVRRDLTALFDAGPQNAPVAAVLDFPLQFLAERQGLVYGPGTQWRTDDYMRTHLGLTDIASYFNAGVLLVDLARYAASGAAERAQAFLARKGDTCIFNDQDALNVALAGQVEILDPRWNFNPDFMVLADGKPMNAALESALRLCCDDPWIVHFAGLKPWERKDAPGRWDLVFWQNLFDIVAANADAIAGTPD